jgi:predicted RNA-binding protein with PIN domain
VRFAPNADDYIVELCAELRGQRDVVVVSADRALIDRARHRGAARLSPWQFAEQCGPTTASDKGSNET